MTNGYRPLASLSLSALDEFARLRNLQQVLEIALEQTAEPLEQRCSRVELLIRLYRAEMELCLDELRVNLEGIRQRVGATLANEESGS
jgi:hypothetical protein